MHICVSYADIGSTLFDISQKIHYISLIMHIFYGGCFILTAAFISSICISAITQIIFRKTIKPSYINTYNIDKL